MATVVGTRFTSVTTTADGDETANFTFFKQKSCSLYQSSIIASIFDDDGSYNESMKSDGDDLGKGRSRATEAADTETVETERKERRVLSELNANGDLLAVAVGEDISIFSFDCGTRFVITVHIGNDIEPVAMKFMPMINVLVILTGCANVIFLSIGCNSVVHRVKLMEDKTVNDASITCECQLENMHMCIVLESGEIYSFVFPNYSEYFHSEQEIETEISNRQKGMSAMIWKRLDIQCVGTNATMINQLNAIFLISLGQETKPVLIDLFAEATDEFDPSGVSGIVRVRYVTYRDQHTFRLIFQIIFALTSDGHLLIWDATTTMLLSSVVLLEAGETADDFMLVDTVPDREGAINENSKLVLLLKDDKGGHKLQIRKLQTYEVIYTKRISNAVYLLDKTTQEEGMILFIELTANELGELNAVNIHAVCECQPEMRLDHLIDRQRWIEAEEFAQTFSLSMEKIYIARIEHFVTVDILDLTGHDTHELVNFLGWMKEVSDENWVAEMCIAAVMYCPSRLWVKKMLEFAASLKITDEETKEKLAMLRYNYQSYREVVGPWQKLGHGDSSEINLWPEFLSGCSWEHIFGNFYKNKQFNEARLLWNRYRKTMEEWVKEKENFEHLLSEIRFSIRDTDCDSTEAVRLLEEDVIPVALLSDPENACACCTSFLMEIARAMEIDHPENFPENSLQIASTMERVVQRLLNSSITPCHQTEVAYALSVIRCFSEEPNEVMGEINVFVRNLREMEKLKNVYRCTMSYNVYEEQTVESICYMILERVRSVQLIKNNIEQYARPYMNEFKLDPDRTLYNYILKIATSSTGVVSTSNPWDERCLTVAESISNLGLRCEALIGVAKRAHPPWTKQLSNAVDAMLNDPTIECKMASRLQEQCDLAALGEVMGRYRIPMHTLERYLEHKHMFAKAMDFIFRQESVEVDPRRRLADALKITKLAGKLRRNLMEYHDCIFQFCVCLIETKKADEWFMDVVCCLNDLKEADRNRVINKLISHVEAILNCPIVFETETEKQLRLRAVEAILCVLERFGRDEVIQDELKAIRKLQVKYDAFFQLSFLNNDNWKSVRLENFLALHFVKHNALPEITELFKISKTLMVKKNVMYATALKYALEKRRLVAALKYAKFAMQDMERINEQLLVLVVRSCCYALWIVPDLAENNEFESVFAIFENMSGLMYELVEATSENISLSSHVFHITLFVNLFNTVVSHCMPEDVEEKADESKEKCLIFGMQRRVGIYQYRMDGNLLSKSDAIKQLAVVARAVVIDVLKSTNLIDFNSGDLLGYYETMQTACKNFFSYLILNNQVLMAICVRMSFALLPCYVASNQAYTAYFDLRGSIELFMERALSHSYADLELCAALIFSAPVAEIKKILVKTRSWAVTRKSPHIMLNLIRLAWFCAVVTDDRSTNKQLNRYYATSLWVKKFGKLGANFPQKVSLETVVQEFVRCLIPPEILIEFCKDFPLDVTEALILYATKIAVRASAEEDCTLAGEMRFTVSSALQEIDVTENLFMRLYACLMNLCPYSYEMIDVIISGMQKYMDQDNTDQEALLRRATITIRFLEVNERTGPPTDHELRWYQERQKFFAKQQGSAHDSTVKVSDGEEPTVPEEGSDPLYKKSSLLIDQLPIRAHRRLPFHPFLFDNEKDLKNTLLPMIHAELTLFNVDNWQMFIRAMPEIEISKSDLVSSAVLLSVQTCINKGTDMDECDIAQIKELIRNATNRLRTLRGLTDGFKHLPLGDIKLRFLSLGIDVIKEWLAESEQGSVQANEDVDFLKHFLLNLEDAYKNYSMEYVLKKYGLLRAETLDLISAPQELIEYIYENEVDWNSCKDINDKVPCANELANILDLDLNEIQERIIQRWLDWDAGTAVLFDPNETSSSDVPLMPMVKQRSDDEIYRLPYMDPTVSRIVHLSRMRGSERAAYAIVDIFRQNEVQGSHESRIRSACCLLRLLRVEQFPKIMKNDLSDICSRLEIMLYTRMIDVYKIDLTIETFNATEKALMLKSLNNSRQTPQLALFMASVVIDYELSEPSIVDMLLTKLCLERKFEMLVELLKYCTTSRCLSYIKNIELKWLRAAQWLFSSIEKGVADEKQQFHRFLLFALSCPVEYGRSIATLLHPLEQSELPVAYRLLSLASSTVAEEDGERPEDWTKATGSNLDFSLRW